MQFSFVRRFVPLMLLLLSCAFAQTPATSDTFDLSTMFLPGHFYSSGEQVWSVAMADMNQDQLIDVVAASKLDGKIFVHFNDGKGDFSNKKSFPSQENNRAVCVLDANKDGFPDVAAVTITGRLTILLNDKKGNLRRTQVAPAGVMTHDVTPGDIDSDGDLDLIITSVNDQTLRFFNNDGNGRFQAGKVLKTGQKPRVVRMGDLDADGLQELVVGGDAGKIYIHWQMSEGDFPEFTSFRSTAATWGLGLGDFDGNGALDIAAASYHEKQLFIHLNEGDGTFQREQELQSGDHNFDLAICDVDMDGDLDVATVSTVDNALNLHFNEGNGVFGKKQKIKSGNWSAGIATADVDGDGDTDYVTGSINDESIVVHRNLTIDPDAQARKTFCIRGTIYNEDTKEIISDAQLSLRDSREESVDAGIASDMGTYEFCPPPGKTYTILVRTQAFPLYEEEFEMPGDMDLEKDIYLAMPKGTFVYGRVKDKSSGRPIPGADLVLVDGGGTQVASLQSNKKGAYRYELPFGFSYEVQGSAAKFDSASEYFDILESDFPKGKRVDLELNPYREPTRACLTGVVRDEFTNEPLPGAQLEIRSIETGRFVTKEADENAAFKSCLPFGEYEISTTQKGYFFKVTPVFVSKEDAREGKEQDILLRPLKVGESIVLENIYYDVDKATLRDESIAELDRVAKVMNDNPTLVVEIAGHTDSDATDAYNQRLSQNRAQSVVDYLVSVGISTERLQPFGYGESKPVAPNDTKENKQLNRRTEFTVKYIDFGEADE